MLLWLGEYQALTVAGFMNQLKRFKKIIFLNYNHIEKLIIALPINPQLKCIIGFRSISRLSLLSTTFERV